MAASSYVLLAAFVALVASQAKASDPGPLQDFCVADMHSNASSLILPSTLPSRKMDRLCGQREMSVGSPREKDFRLPLSDLGNPDEFFVDQRWCYFEARYDYNCERHPEEFVKWIVQAGEGCEPSRHLSTFEEIKPHEAQVHFTGKMLDDTEFVSTKGNHAPMTFKLIQDDVMKGFSLAVSSMKPGEKAVFAIPQEYALSNSGCPASIPRDIPPDQTLRFDIELICFITDIHKDQGILKKTIKYGTSDGYPRQLDEVFDRSEEPSYSAPLGAMGSLLRRLGKLPDICDVGSISQLREDVHSIRDMLKNLSEVHDPPLTATYWMKHARELSYDMEDSFDDSDAKSKECSIDDSGGQTEDSIGDSDDKISAFSTRVKGLIERYKRFNLHSVLNGDTATTTLLSHRPSRDVVLVGMDNRTENIRSLLEPKGDDKYSSQLKIVSILGVEGVGKSTLIGKIWRELESEGYIKCRAFVRTARKPDIRVTLRSILSQVRRHEPAEDSGVPNLIHDIRTHLQDKRYFIIIEDLWDLSVWDVVRRAFPDCGVGSRIITTTADEDVALVCCSYDPKHTYIMEPLSVGHSKELFIRTIVGSGKGNFQLSDDVSDEIERKCGGIPLAIICTAIIVANQPEIRQKLCQLETEHELCKSEKEQNLDSDVKNFLENNLRTCSTPGEILNQVLKLCYRNLPHCLKTCLLYLNVYPENYLILKRDLVNLWIVEGFICTTKEEDKTEVAGSYFDVLVSLGLIQRMNINSNKPHHQGKVVEEGGEEDPYVVHPTVFDFITHKSTEDNFITIIDYSQPMVALKDKIRRLTLYFGSAAYGTTPASIGLSQVRTLSFMGLLNCMPSLTEFKLVRVMILHLWADDGDTIFSLADICKLLLLRYLQVRCNVTVQLPGQMGCLKHLETLEINSEVTAVPQDIFHLPRLVHVRIGGKTYVTPCPVTSVNVILSDDRSSVPSPPVASPITKFDPLTVMEHECGTTQFSNLPQDSSSTPHKSGGMYGMPTDRYGVALDYPQWVPYPRYTTHGGMHAGTRAGSYTDEGSQKKPAGAGRDNDWECPNCHNINFSFQTVCDMRKCNTPRPENQGSKPDSSRGSKPKMPEGSWKCEQCNNINYPFRTKCNRPQCGAEKPLQTNNVNDSAADQENQVRVPKPSVWSSIDHAFIQKIKLHPFFSTIDLLKKIFLVFLFVCA